MSSSRETCFDGHVENSNRLITDGGDSDIEIIAEVFSSVEEPFEELEEESANLDACIEKREEKINGQAQMEKKVGKNQQEAGIEVFLVSQISTGGKDVCMK